MNINELSLATLAGMRLEAKSKEDAAIAHRRDIDAAIAAKLKDREEGTVSRSEDGLKVSVTYKLDRKVDSDKLATVWPNLSEPAQAAFKWKAEASVTELRKLQEFRPDDFRVIADLVTTKPGSPSVKVEPITKE